MERAFVYGVPQGIFLVKDWFADYNGHLLHIPLTIAKQSHHRRSKSNRTNDYRNDNKDSNVFHAYLVLNEQSRIYKICV